MSDHSSTRHRDFYREESSVYHVRRYETRYGRLFRELHHQSLSEFLRASSCEFPVLEIACGTGHTSELLAREGIQFIACDLTADMMKQTVERMAAAQYPTRLLLADAQRLPFPDAAFNVIVTTRFLHLFPLDEQRTVLLEAVRVLKPGGTLVVDFDNWAGRWIFGLPFLIYNIIRYRRLAPYSVYNRVGETLKMLADIGVRTNIVHGVGGPHLIALEWISHRLAVGFGVAHRRLPLRVLAEQFMVMGTKL